MLQRETSVHEAVRTRRDRTTAIPHEENPAIHKWQMSNSDLFRLTIGQISSCKKTKLLLNAFKHANISEPVVETFIYNMNT